MQRSLVMHAITNKHETNKHTLTRTHASKALQICGCHQQQHI